MAALSDRLKDLKDCTLYLQDGFSGTAAVDDASISATDTVIGVDTLSLFDSRLTIPIGARFTTAGITTIRTVTATQNSTVYTLDMTSPSAGTFTVTHSGNTTAGIAFDVAAATFQTTLEGLASIGSGNVTVTEATDVYTITFAGTLANTEQTITVDGSSLTAANSHVLTQTQDGTTTWEITFTPAIASGSVPSDDDVITFYPRRIAFEVETGDFNYTFGRNPIIRRKRGRISGLREGDEKELEFSTSFSHSWLRVESTLSQGNLNGSNLEDTTVYEVLNQQGFASDWTPSSHGDPCEPFSIDIVIVDAPTCGSEQAEVLIFPQAVPAEVSFSFNDGVGEMSGVCAATKPITHRVANTSTTYDILY